MDAKWSKLYALFFLVSLDEKSIKLLEKDLKGSKIVFFFVTKNIDLHSIK